MSSASQWRENNPWASRGIRIACVARSAMNVWILVRLRWENDLTLIFWNCAYITCLNFLAGQGFSVSPRSLLFSAFSHPNSSDTVESHTRFGQERVSGPIFIKWVVSWTRSFCDLAHMCSNESRRYRLVPTEDIGVNISKLKSLWIFRKTWIRILSLCDSSLQIFLLSVRNMLGFFSVKTFVIIVAGIYFMSKD